MPVVEERVSLRPGAHRPSAGSSSEASSNQGVYCQTRGDRDLMMDSNATSRAVWHTIAQGAPLNPVHGVLPATLSRCVETCSAAY